MTINIKVQRLLQQIDIEKTKEDLRKIGLTIIGAGFLGVFVGQVNILPGLFLITTGLIGWYFGVAK